MGGGFDPKNAQKTPKKRLKSAFLFTEFTAFT